MAVADWIPRHLAHAGCDALQPRRHGQLGLRGGALAQIGQHAVPLALGQAVESGLLPRVVSVLI